MKKFFSMVCACLLALSAQATDIKKYDALYENLPFQMEKVTRPQFPANEVNLKDFGAIGDGSSLCTTAFAKAIDALTQKGGGKLIVPQGVWFTGPIVLKSNINLHLEKGAVILFSPDDALYPFIETSFEGLDTRRCQSPISGHHLTNVAITGQGVHRRKRRILAPIEEAEGYRCPVEADYFSWRCIQESRLLVPIRRCIEGRQQCQHECA